MNAAPNIAAARGSHLRLIDGSFMPSRSYAGLAGVWGKEAQKEPTRRAVPIRPKGNRARAGRDAAPALPPRLLSREAAAAYCGCDSLSTFDDWVRRGIIPRPLPGTHRWDRRAIDTALDKAGGLVNDSKNESEYGAWKKHARQN
jgi:hypothetical protein